MAAPVCTNIGNPHATFFVADAADIDLATLGPVLEHDAHAYLNSMPAPGPATNGHKAEAVVAARKVTPAVVGAGAAAS